MGGERPGNGAGFLTQERSTKEGCAFQCVNDNSDKCHSFGIRQTGSDEEHDVSFQNCHLLDGTRSEYADKKQIRNDNKYDLYEPLQLVHNTKKKNAVALDAPGDEVLRKLYIG